MEGSIDSFIDEANQYLAKGVFGFDLLGYRYTGDAKLLNKTVVESVDAPVCLAGSVDSFENWTISKRLNPGLLQSGVPSLRRNLAMILLSKLISSVTIWPTDYVLLLP
mgnify:CR=1 FL=1